ncbi:MAG: HYR domain-containing protein, partial [bacterium]
MRYHSAGKFIFYWLAILLALAMTTAASAKSLYMLANHHTNQFDAWNINPDGTVTYQATYGLSFTQEPSGLALDADSGTLFFTDEFNVPGQDPAIEMVDAVSMKSLGSVVPRGRDGRPVRDLAGIDVDDKHNIVYIVQRRRPDIYVYDWDPNFIVVNPTNPDEVIVDSRAMTLRDGYPQALPGVVGAFGIALDERAGVLYVADSRDRKVKGFNTNTWEEVLNFTPTGLVPGGIAVDRRKGIIYTTAPDLAVEECCFGLRNVFGPEGSTKISKYDLATGLETVMDMSLAGLNHGGMGIWVDEVTGYLYVTGGCTGDDLTIWDTSTPTSPDIPFTLVHASGPIGNPAALAIGNISYNPLHLTIPQEECAKPGESITYTICYDNMDNEDYVTNVRIVDKLPDQDKVSFVEATDGGVYDEATHTVTWNVDELPGGSRQCIRVVVQVNPAIPSTAILKSFVTITSDQTPQPTTVVDERSVCCLPGNCPPIGITVDYIDPDRCMAAVSWTEPTFENCDGPLIVTVQAVYPDGSTRDNVKPGDLFPITCGTPGTIVTYTAWDSVDDRVIGQCSFPIEILDQPPVVDYCPADIVQCSAQVTWELPRFRDDCVLPPVPGKAVYPDGSTSDDVQPGDTFPIGTTIITYTAEDRCGNTASCTFKVTVGGDEPLTCTCPSDITVNNDPGRCGAAVGWELPSCSDNCGEIFTVTCDH